MRGASTVNVADLLEDPTVAVIEVGVFCATAVVVRLNVAEVAPLAIVTEAGAVAAVVLEANLTVRSAVAAATRSTVPVDGVPPVNEEGETFTSLTAWPIAAPANPETAAKHNNTRETNVMDTCRNDTNPKVVALGIDKVFLT